MSRVARLKIQVSRLLPRSSFARSVGALVGGTAVAQIITILTLPLLTRVYTPEDFNVLAVFTALLGTISSIACLRLEIAIPLPKDDAPAINLLLLSLIFSTIIASLIGALLLLFSENILYFLKQPKLHQYLWMLPLGIWLAGVYAAIQYWATRKKRFPSIAQTRMTQAIGGISVQLAFGVLGKFGPFGLLLGQLMTTSLGILKLSRFAYRDIRSLERVSDRKTLHQTLQQYSRFPKYSTLEAFANTAAIEIPIIIIGAAGIGPEAGFLFLAMKAAAIPMGLIGGAIAQVYLSRAPDEARAGQLPQFTIKIITRLITFGVGPLIALGIVAPSAVPMLFGSQWTKAGSMISWMMPWFVMQFLSSPVSMSLHVTSNQRLALILQLTGLLVRVGVSALCAKYCAEHLVIGYALSGLFFYFLYFVTVLNVSGVETRILVKASRKGLAAVGAWCIIGVGASHLLG